MKKGKNSIALYMPPSGWFLNGKLNACQYVRTAQYQVVERGRQSCGMKNLAKG